MIGPANLEGAFLPHVGFIGFRGPLEEDACPPFLSQWQPTITPSFWPPSGSVLHTNVNLASSSVINCDWFLIAKSLNSGVAS